MTLRRSCAVIASMLLVLTSGWVAASRAQAADADGCLTGAGGRPFAVESLASLTGQFTATTVATPSAGADAAVALSRGNATRWLDLSVIVRFAPNGLVDARDGTVYRGAGMRWTAGTAYTVRMVVDVTAKRYSAFVAAPGGAEAVVGTNLAFRDTANTVTSLDTHVAAAQAGSITSCGFRVGSGASCMTVSGGLPWPRTTFPAQSGRFSVELSATPTGIVDAGVGLSRGAPSGWPSLAAIVRFAPNGRIDARNGSVYMPSTIPYVANETYRIRMLVDVPAKRYSAFVTPTGQAERTLVLNAMFRTEQQRVVALDSLVAARTTGTLRVCDPSVKSASAMQLAVNEVVGGRDIPWDVAPTPDGALLFTERSGRLSVRTPAGEVRTLATVGDLYRSNTTGLTSVIPDPDFPTNHTFYTCQGWTNGTSRDIRVVRWTTDATYATASRVGTVLSGIPTVDGRHAGCRLKFGSDGYLYIGTGDAMIVGAAQNVNSLAGKVLRVDRTTGLGAPGNPFASSANANARRVWTFGHRNIQGLAPRPGTPDMVEIEHGTDRDDELNLLRPGANFGWGPGPSYDESQPMTDLGKYPGATRAIWSSGSPTLATSGGTFLSHPRWGPWQGRLIVACLKSAQLVVFSVDATGRVIGQEIGLRGFGRLRSVSEAPDGALYVTTSDGGLRDRILRVVPTAAAG